MLRKQRLLLGTSYCRIIGSDAVLLLGGTHNRAWSRVDRSAASRCLGLLGTEKELRVGRVQGLTELWCDKALGADELSFGAVRRRDRGSSVGRQELVGETDVLNLVGYGRYRALGEGVGRHD